MFNETLTQKVDTTREEMIELLNEDLADEYQAWLDEVRAIFPNVVDLASSPYGAAANFYDVDPVHFKAEAGVRFMNEKVMPVARKVVQERKP